MAKNKCNYCGRELSNDLEYCSNKCKNNYENDIEHDTKNIKYFVMGIVLGVIITFVGVFLSNDKILGIGIMLLGAIVVLFPFVTPETTAIFGYKRAKIVGRILGLMLEVVGIWVVFF